jgi:hypothetical protein
MLMVTTERLGVESFVHHVASVCPMFQEQGLSHWEKCSPKPPERDYFLSPPPLPPSEQNHEATKATPGFTRLLMIRDRLSQNHTGLHSETKQIELPTSMPIGVVGVCAVE